VLAKRLQLRIKDGDYERFKSATKDSRAKELAYINALFKIRTENHIQCVVVGDVGQGKSTTATVLALYDTRFTRLLLKLENWREYLKYGEKIKFNLTNHVIISPKDPAKKFVGAPKPYNGYELDEGYLWATTSEASTRATKQFIENIIQNRKLHPSFYHVYQNLFKMPSRVLELMNEVLLKLYVNQGALLVPTRMIQIAEKFDRARLERYAKHPNTFESSIKYHPAFVSMLKTPKWSEKFHERYLQKYEKYKISEAGDEKQKTTAEEQLFKSLDRISKQRMVEMNTKADVKALLMTVFKDRLSENSADSMSNLLAERYITWKENQAINLLSDRLNEALTKKIKLEGLENLAKDENATIGE
jgi:5'(3')-deoxyribonucleotidase